MVEWKTASPEDKAVFERVVDSAKEDKDAANKNLNDYINQPKVLVPETLAEDSPLVRSLHAFAKACCNDLTTVDLSLPTLTQPGTAEALALGGLSEVKLVNDNGTDVLSALVLPPGGEWPFFADTKQRDATGRDVVFRRLGLADRARVDHTVQRLRGGRLTAWIGAPGIGKSTGMNDVLLKLLQNLGDDGWPAQVAVRVHPFIHVFTLDAGHVHVTTHDAKDLSQVGLLSRELQENKGVLLLELLEDESGPSIACPVAVTLSNQHADEKLKEMCKSGLEWLVVGPPSLEEIRAMALFLLARGDVTLGESAEVVLATVEKRFDVVGPILRYILCTEMVYDAHVRELEGVDGQMFNVDLQRTSLFNVPRGAGTFMASFLKGGFVGIPYNCKTIYEWRFLSSGRAAAAALLATRFPAIVASLERFGVKWQLQEAVVMCALQDQTTGPEFALGTWEWYANPERLNGSVLVPLPGPPVAVVKRSSSHFAGCILRRNVRELNEHTVYKSEGYQGVLADFFTVDHAQKKVFAFQVSDRLPDAHPFKIEQFRNVSDALQLKATRDGDHNYTLVLVYICPQDKRTISSLKGIKVLDGEKSLSLKVALKRPILCGLDIQGYVVRAPITPNEKAVIYNEKKLPDKRR